MANGKNGKGTDQKTYKQLEKEHEALQKRYDSLVKAVQKLEKRLENRTTENEFHKKQLENAELNIHQQKQLLINVATENNRMKDDMAAEIGQLKTKIKSYENGDNDRLGHKSN